MKIKSLSDEQIAGQRLMAGFDGTRLNDDLKFLINTIKVGGIILFARNLSSPDQIKDLCFSAREYALQHGQPPIFISIDQEGGQVARLKAPFTQFPGNPAMKTKEDAVFFAETTAKELTEVGINMDLAPVLDIAHKGINSIMAGRAFGSDPEQVSSLGVKVIEHLQQNKIISVAKHFPGIGRTTLDSHLEMPFLNTGIKDIEDIDLMPFEAAIKHNVAGIMLSHIFYRNIDSKWPASLSIKIAKDLLRGQLEFNGITITDDLDMGAIKKNYDIKTIIQQILSADIDIALICHKGPDIEKAFYEILKSLKDSETLRKKGIQSAERIMQIKEKYLYPVLMAS